MEYYLIPKAVVDEINTPYPEADFNEGVEALLSKAIKVDLDELSKKIQTFVNDHDGQVLLLTTVRKLITEYLEAAK